MSLYYTTKTCEYDINNLEKAVYLIEADGTTPWLKYIDWSEQNYVSTRNTFSTAISGFSVNSISVEEGSELNGRYSFSHQVNFSVNGYLLSTYLDNGYGKGMLSKEYHVILKKKGENIFFLLNPTIPCKLEYTFTLGENESHTDFTLHTVSNEPLLNMTSSYTVSMITMYDKPCEYFLDGFNNMKMKYARHVRRNGNAILSNNQFIDVNSMMKGAVFTEAYDGDNMVHTITFTSKMKRTGYINAYDWQYALLQFDNFNGNFYVNIETDNKLCALIESDRGDHFFVSDLIPNYTANGGDNEYLSAEVTLTSTSNDANLSSSLLDGFNGVTINYTTHWEYVQTEYDPCDEDGNAMYILKSRKDIFGNDLGTWQAKSGYTDLFSNDYLLTSTTFTEDAYYPSDKCAQYKGSTGGTLPSSVTLYSSGGCSSYTFSASCDWYITTSFEDTITVSPTSGYAGEMYNISVCYAQTRWVTSGYTCVGVDKYAQEIEQISYDGTTWTDTGNTRRGSLIEANSTDCGYVPPTPPTIDGYLEFKSVTNSTYRFSNDVQYSTDDGTTWTTLTANTDTPTISANSTILWRGNITASTVSGVGTFSSSGQFTAYGNPLSLADSSGFSSASIANHQFRNLFAGCSGLTSAQNLVLSSTTIAPYCYASMFSGCTSLTSTPTLPSPTMEDWCYHSMFAECTSLTSAPTLSASTLAAQCYEGMFRGCTSLTTAPILSATTLAYSCYRSMFQDCSGLTTAPSLPATTLTESCYSVMFLNCTSLTTAPTLSAATVAKQAYMQMFQGCTSLNNVTCLATDISAENATYWWLYNVASSGTFTKHRGMTSWTSDASGIPTNWTVNDAH